jgi:hypothetical protein
VGLSGRLSVIIRRPDPDPSGLPTPGNGVMPVVDT